MVAGLYAAKVWGREKEKGKKDERIRGYRNEGYGNEKRRTLTS
jgi:hypothetical protein